MVDFYKRHDDASLGSIPLKANKLLYFLLSLLLLIALRLWHLTVIQHEKKCDEAFRPRKKIVIEASERGTIRDRFNTPIAINTMEYRLAVVYSQIREIPAIAFESKQQTKKKRFLRKEYIHALSKVIAKETGLDQERVEDQIHSHAALYDTIPFVLKSGLSEETYYRLKILEKDFPGLQLQRLPRRHYPYGKVGSHLIGYLGSMQKERYEKLANEIRALSEYIRQTEFGIDCEAPDGIETVEEARLQLLELQERAYTLHDNVGILGIESEYEEQLRGYAGRRLYFSDAKGNFVREMPGSHPPISGKRLLLSVSIELQEFAEKLLAQSEKDRERGHQKTTQKEPWMRGGAIVAIDPHTGEVIALASYPRFDPNDFVQRDKTNVLRWIESEAYQAKIWDGVLPLQRELIDDTVAGEWYTEEKMLSWKHYIEMILPIQSPLLQALSQETKIEELVVAQRAFDEIMKKTPALAPQDAMKLLYASNQESDIALFYADIASYKAILDDKFRDLDTIQEKLLYLDLSRLVLSHEDFSPDLVKAIGAFSIAQFRKLSCNVQQQFQELRKEAKKVFHEHAFRTLRKEHEKEYLRKQRNEEKVKKRHPKPYLDYIDRWEKQCFQEFWEQWRYSLLEYSLTKCKNDLPEYCLNHFSSYQLQWEHAAPPELIIAVLRSAKSFADLELPLYGHYRGLAGNLTKHLAAAFVKSSSGGYMRPYGFRQSTIQGSIFKLVTAYTGLKQRYEELQVSQKKINTSDLHLFTLTDHTYKANQRLFVGTFADGKPIPQMYKGGRIPKSLHHHLGEMDLVRAIETSGNPYFSILAGDYLHNPEDLRRAAIDFGYGEKTGISIPGEIAGNVPSDLSTNRTGLYATAIGQHTLITTPLQTAVMLSAIANGGTIIQPKMVCLVAGKTIPSSPFPFPTPLVVDVPSEIKRTIFLPPEIREVLLTGMKRSVQRTLGDSASLARLRAVHPVMHADFVNLQGQFVGKTSTAEVIERVGLDVPKMYRHIWFGGISFTREEAHNHCFTFSDSFGQPELIVVVYLRFGGYGREVAPIAAQVVQKWRQISKKYSIER